MTQPTHQNVSSPVTGASRASAILKRRTSSAGVDLFAAYGIRLTPEAATANVGDGGKTALRGVDQAGDTQFLGIAGFAGPHFSGFVAFSTSEHLLRRSNCTMSSCSDWMAELGNQLLGRIKNALLREGIAIHRVPPAVMRGHSASMLCPRLGTKPVAFSDDKDMVLIWTEVEPSFEIDQEPPTPDPQVMAEGDMVLF